MPVPEGYLLYPRRYGMDQDRHDWSVLFRHKPVAWPNGARIALVVSPMLEWFPLDMRNQPFRPPGGLERPYPDYRYYTHRDYGTRVGIFRVMEVLDDLAIRASVAINSDLAERHPFLVGEVARRSWEVVAYGVNMDQIHHGRMRPEDEPRLVRKCVESLRALSGQPVVGWHSPAKSESKETLDHLAAAGIKYVCDWASDDLPIPMRTKSGTVYAFPHSVEIDDRVILMDYHQTEEQFVQQVKDQFDWLYAEAGRDGGRVMSIVLHPWVIGHPYRMKPLREALSYVMGFDGVWSGTAAEVVAAYEAQTQP